MKVKSANPTRTKPLLITIVLFVLFNLAFIAVLGVARRYHTPSTAQAKSVPQATPQSKMLRGVFTDRNDGRPFGMWVIDKGDHTVMLFVGDSARPKIVRLDEQGEGQFRSASGALYGLRWRGGQMSLLNYRGTVIDTSGPLTDGELRGLARSLLD